MPLKPTPAQPEFNDDQSPSLDEEVRDACARRKDAVRRLDAEIRELEDRLKERRAQRASLGHSSGDAVPPATTVIERHYHQPYYPYNAPVSPIITRGSYGACSSSGGLSGAVAINATSECVIDPP